MLIRKSYQVLSCSEMFTRVISPEFSSKIPFFHKNPSSISTQNHCVFPNFTTNQSTKPSIMAKHSIFLLRYFSNTRIIQAKPSRLESGIITDAQKDLFAYLHHNKAYIFPDADHISKNAPVFLQNMISKLKLNESVAKHLQFHTINEFEPFFESLGLTPDQYKSILPNYQFFLSEDPTLISNFHILYNYGVPRSKIGKFYMEVPEIFKYHDGVLISKIQNYEKLGLGAAEIITLITCCPNFLIGDVNLDFLRVLEKLRSLGVKFDSIIHGLSDKNTYNWVRIFEMLNFLEKMGCEKETLATLIKEKPTFVFFESGKKIYLLVAILTKLGFKMDNILNLFMKNPHLLIGNFIKYLHRSIYFLFEIGTEIKDIASIISSNPQILGSSSFHNSNSFLQNHNLTRENLRDIINTDPAQFINLAMKKNIKSSKLPKYQDMFIKEKTEFLLKLGFVENSDEMIKAATKFRGRGDELQERFDCLVKAGIDCHVAVDLVKAYPPILNQSASVIEKKIDYLMNEAGYEVESLVAFPSSLAHNMEKMRLRFEMVKWVGKKRNKKRMKEKIALSSVLASSEDRFVKFFVDVHPEGRNYYETLKKSILGC